MKTTVEIADSLLSEAMAQARQRGQTLRQVLDEGLRLVLARERAARRRFRLRDASQNLGPMLIEDSWPVIRRIIYEGRSE